MNWLAPSSRWSQALQGPEFRVLLPAMGWLPLEWAYNLADWRGRLNTRYDRDWVSLALGRSHISPLTKQGLEEIIPASQIPAALEERYRTLAREEFETRILAKYGLTRFDIDADAALTQLANRPPNRGLLLLTTHFETFMLGVAALASRGEKIHLVISEVSNDPRLHPAIRHHFQNKYTGLERLLNGGKLLEIEHHQRHYYKALKAGEVVVILADAPALSADTGVWLPWMGQLRAVAQGALRLGKSTNSMIGAFACHHLGLNRHQVVLSPLQDTRSDNISATEEAHTAAFSFLEKHMRQNPGRWWGVHLLPYYPVIPKSPSINYPNPIAVD